MPDEKTEAFIPVGVGVRIVPAGIVSRDQRRFLRAALLLSPVAADRPGVGRTVDLRHWPKEIEREFVGSDIAAWADVGKSPVGVMVASVDKQNRAPGAKVGGGLVRRVPAVRAMYHDRRALSGNSALAIGSWKNPARGRRDEDRKAVARTPGPDRRAGGVECSRPGDQAGRDRAPRFVEGVPRQAAGAAQAQSPGKEGEYVAVSPMGRAEAAIVLSTERARSLIERLKSFKSTAGAVLRPVNLAYEPFEPLDWGGGWPSLGRSGAEPCPVRQRRRGRTDARRAAGAPRATARRGHRGGRGTGP